MNDSGIVDKAPYTRYLIILIAVSTVVRGLIAALFELGNDEVYYWTYALYPDLSHFDHPPMVGWVIQIFSLNLAFDHEFFLRLGSVIGGSLNTWLMFCLGKAIHSKRTGWYSALLFSASIYGFIIAGTFILPDTPQTTFWLLALLIMFRMIHNELTTAPFMSFMSLLGLVLGLGMLSKYTTLFLWVGWLIFILLFRRKWLRHSPFYLMNIIAAALFSIVLIWNYQNQFISFTYQGERGLVKEWLINPDTFLTEVLGEVVYNNPLNFVWILLALFWVFRKRIYAAKPEIKLLLICGLPLALVFLLVSLFRSTLPHWSGPGYLTLLPLAAYWIDTRTVGSANVIPRRILSSLGIMMVVLLLGTIQVNTGFLKIENASGYRFRDYSLEIYGWRAFGGKVNDLSKAYESEGGIQENSPILSYRWFPAAHLEYYVAKPAGKVVLASGTLDAIHKYAWINRIHGGFHLNSDAWYITSSRDFRDPRSIRSLYYERIMPPDTIPIIRQKDTAYYFYVYRLLNLQSKPVDPLAPSRAN